MLKKLLRIAVTVCVVYGLVLIDSRVEASEETQPGTQCSALAAENFFDVQDAPAQVTATTLLQAQADQPAYCRVEGYVAPQVGFELRLPTSGWNGNFLAVGNGGWGGRINASDCAPYLQRGYACLASDTGHKSSRSGDPLWAWNNLEAQVDYAFRATHVASLVGKAIAERFYSSAPKRSYFLGCSGGGYQALVQAQLFPWDFDGIIAGAPTLNVAELGMRQAWNTRSFTDDQGRPLLDPAAIDALHAAVLAQCDRDDGVADGIVGNPLACKPDLRKLTCNAGRRSGCLAPAQIEAVRKLYAGPATSDGVSTSLPGLLPGSELNWMDPKQGLGFGGRGTDFFKYEYYRASQGPPGAQFDFDRDLPRLGMGALYTHNNPDLRKFKAAGGKLIAYQGGTDLTGLVMEIVDYYQAVERTMGGRATTQSFFRLFMVPGMNHCAGGAGASSFGQDLRSAAAGEGRALQNDSSHHVLRALEAWVETGKPPDQIVAARYVDDDPDKGVGFTRPLCPYPEVAVYSGKGNKDKAASFQCRKNAY